MKTKAILVAHDAGGAEIVSLWAAENIQDVYAIIEGPAVDIFEKNLPQYKTISFDNALQSQSVIITGSSWQSNLEKNVIKAAKAKGRYCCSILDHWTNYRDRFLINGQLYLPNEIWASDKDALRIAIEVFGEEEVLIDEIKNPYLNKVKTEYMNYAADERDGATLESAKSILYICESIDEHSIKATGSSRGLTGYTEKEAYKYFIQNICLVAPCIENVIIRPHPSQLNIISVEWMIELSKPYNGTISNEKNLVRDFVKYDIVAGMESMALAASVFIGKSTISAIPQGGKACSLPMKNIIHLSDQINEQ